MTDPASDDVFPELEELQAGLALRHRRLLQIMVASSIILVVVGAIFVVISQDPEKLGYALPGLFLVVLGIFGLGRAAYSKFTDYDTRDREEFVGVATHVETHAAREKNDDDSVANDGVDDGGVDNGDMRGQDSESRQVRDRDE